ncbi:MAG: hypothetical protein K6L80_12445 [Agarilytica sp.]
MSFKFHLLSISIILAITGCGGGSDDSSSTNQIQARISQDPSTLTAEQLKQNYLDYSEVLYSGSRTEAETSPETISQFANHTMSNTAWNVPWVGQSVWQLSADAEGSEKITIPDTQKSQPNFFSKEITDLISKQVIQAQKKQVSTLVGKPVNESLPCDDSGSVEAAGDLDDNGQGNLRLTFSNCANHPVFQTNGDATISFENISEDSIEYSVYFNELSVTAGDELFLFREAHTITGYIHISYSNLSFDYTRTENLLYTPQSGGQQFYARMTTQYNDNQQNASGQIFLGDEGYLNVDADAGLYYARYGGVQVTFQGANNIVVSLDIPYSGPTEYLVDDNGDGVFDRGTYINSLEEFIDEENANLTLVNVDELSLPPVIFSSPRIENSYPAPTTLNDIIVSPGYYEDEDTPADELIISYEWQLNDVVVEDVTGSIFPAGRAVFEDVVSVTLIVSDGTSETRSTRRNITIADAPSTPIIVNIPQSIAPGETLSVVAQYIDPDIPDSQQPADLVYGPTGMTIDDTGTIEWDAFTPLFESVTIRFGIRDANESESETTEYTFDVEIPEAELPIARTGILAPNSNKNILVGDFTGSSDKEIAISDGRSLQLVTHDNGAYKELWTYPYSIGEADQILQLLKADLDDDENSELLIVTAQNIFTMNDINSAILPIFSTESYIQSAQTLDSDNDGIVELALIYSESTYGSGSKSVAVIELSSPQETLFDTVLSTSTRTIVIGNVDSDEALEIVTNDGFVYDTTTWGNEWFYSQGFGNGHLALSDIDGDNTQEILGAESYDALNAFSAVSKTNLALTTDGMSVCGLYSVNINSDNLDEVFIVPCSTYSAPDVAAYNITDGALEEVWSLTLNSGSIQREGFTVGDTNNDGTIDVVLNAGRGYTSGSDGTFAIATTTASITDYTYRSASTDHISQAYALGWAEVSSGNEQAVYITPEINLGYGGQHLTFMSPSGEYVVSEEISERNQGKWGALTDFNNDGFGDVFLATGIRSYDSGLSALQLSDVSEHWNTGDLSENATSIKAFDFNNDGFEDAIYADGSTIRIVDITNQIVLAGLNADSAIRDIAVSLGDEILIAECTYRGLNIWQKSGETYSVTSTSTDECDYVEFGNVDDDADMEVVTVDNSYQSSLIRTYELGSETLQEAHNISLDYNVTDLLFDVSETNNQTIIAGAHNRTTDRYGNRGNIINFAPQNPSILWSSPNLIGQIARGNLHFRPNPEEGKHRLMFSTSRGVMYTVK